MVLLLTESETTEQNWMKGFLTYGLAGLHAMRKMEKSENHYNKVNHLMKYKMNMFGNMDSKIFGKRTKYNEYTSIWNNGFKQAPM